MIATIPSPFDGRRCAILALLLLSSGAHAADMQVSVQIPRLDVAEYHRPYVAIWIEQPDQSVAAQLAVWYQTDPNKEDGRQWLKDLRQWWRRGGRELAVPIDGVTGATRPVGDHKLSLKAQGAALAGLAPGQYAVVVEAVREVGGRELLRLPFEWPVKSKQHAETRGKSELGRVSVDLNP
jgi:hypothetical protein